jgi:hypothetical protein
MSPDEEVLSYTIDNTLGQAYAIVGVKDNNGAVVSNRGVVLGPQGFNMLMEEKPSWSPNKPAKNFRNEDLVVVIDLIEAQQE